MAKWPSVPFRWHAVVVYRADSGLVEVEHDFEELRQLHDLVELGPSWATIERILVTYAGDLSPITIETAATE